MGCFHLSFCSSDFYEVYALLAHCYSIKPVEESWRCMIYMCYADVMRANNQAKKMLEP